jgi:uncharacterized protein YeaO (DUF488 family)
MTKKAKRARKRPARAKRRSSIGLKRAYDPPGADDGLRILVDRLWPRGLKKTKLKADAWPKHLAPSTELRRWYQHDPERYAEFRRRYLAELKDNGESLDELRALLRGHKVTLLTATRELELSHARVLREVLGG